MAERHREALQAQLNGITDIDDGGAGKTWQAFEAVYLEATRADLATATANLARWTLTRFRTYAGARWLNAVRRETVESYRIRRLQEVGHETVRKELRVLHAAFGWAVAQEWIHKNPCEGVHCGRRERPEPVALSEPETARLLALLENEPAWVWASLRLACLWGPRAGELARITREDVDLGRRLLSIRSAKGGRGRMVPLDPETAGLLHELSHTDRPILWGPCEAWRGRSQRAYLGRLRKESARLLAAAGVADRRQPLQILRRTAETGMRRRGVPTYMIARVIGHGTAVGDQWYDGLGPEGVADQVARLMCAGGPIL
jgi:integrase/recombinase XerC/integrase/recombinase XerD